jgi:hypothetical protein
VHRRDRRQGERRRAGTLDRGEHRGGPVAVVGLRHHVDDEALGAGAGGPFQHRRRVIVLQQQHAAAGRHRQHLRRRGGAVADRGDQRHVAGLGVDQLRRRAPRPLVLLGGEARVEGPGLSLARNAGAPGILHRDRQRTPGGGIQVADVARNIEQRALR